MGYLKRKRTKRRGKKGTKKYRGGANAGTVTNSGASNALKSKFNESSDDQPSANTETSPSGNAAIQTAKAEVKTQIESLKSKLDQVDVETADLDKLNTLSGAMTTFMPALGM